VQNPLVSAAPAVPDDLEDLQSSRLDPTLEGEGTLRPASGRDSERGPPCRIDEALRNSEGTFRSPRMVEAEDTGAVEGRVSWKPVKSAWISGLTLAAPIGGPLCFTWAPSRCSSPPPPSRYASGIRSACIGA
jgi:hypothetical protein